MGLAPHETGYRRDERHGPECPTCGGDDTGCECPADYGDDDRGPSYAEHEAARISRPHTHRSWDVV